MKTVWSFVLLCFLNNVYGQKIYQFKYISSDEFDVGVLTVSNNAFRFDSFQSIIKPAGNNKVYLFTQSDSRSVAIEAKIDQYEGSDLFRYKGDILTGEKAFKIDTIYYNTDSIINGSKCRKVGINYARGQVIDEKTNRIWISDTLNTIIWVNKSIKIVTPFSFTSKKLSGLVMRFERRSKYSNNHFYITVDSQYFNTARVDIFDLPVNCKILASQVEYDEESMHLVSKKLGNIEDN